MIFGVVGLSSSILLEKETDFGFRFRTILELLAKDGHSIVFDPQKGEPIDCCLSFGPHPQLGKYNVMFMVESIVVRPHEWFIDVQSYDHVFSWDPSICTHANTSLLAYPVIPFEKWNYNFKRRSKKIVIIVAKKRFKSKYSLSEKRDAMIWELSMSNVQYDFFGRGWYNIGFKFYRYQNIVLRLMPFLKYFIPVPPGYLGEVNNKHTTLQAYRYALVFENSNYPNYISEKIYDCIANGTVPLLVGTKTLPQYLSKLDLIQVDGIEDVKQFIENISYEDYERCVKSLQFQLKQIRSSVSVESQVQQIYSKLCAIINDTSC
jgi:hypothetical protein